MPMGVMALKLRKMMALNAYASNDSEHLGKWWL